MSYHVQFVAAGKAAAYAELNKQIKPSHGPEADEASAAIGILIGTMPDGHPIAIEASGSTYDGGGQHRIEVRVVRFVVAE